jgi:hypothetical protein
MMNVECRMTALVGKRNKEQGIKNREQGIGIKNRE